MRWRRRRGTRRPLPVAAVFFALLAAAGVAYLLTTVTFAASKAGEASSSAAAAARASAQLERDTQRLLADAQGLLDQLRVQSDELNQLLGDDVAAQRNSTAAVQQAEQEIAAIETTLNALCQKTRCGAPAIRVSSSRSSSSSSAPSRPPPSTTTTTTTTTTPLVPLTIPKTHGANA